MWSFAQQIEAPRSCMTNVPHSLHTKFTIRQWQITDTQTKSLQWSPTTQFQFFTNQSRATHFNEASRLPSHHCKLHPSSRSCRPSLHDEAQHEANWIVLVGHSHSPTSRGRRYTCVSIFASRLGTVDITLTWTHTRNWKRGFQVVERIHVRRLVMPHAYLDIIEDIICNWSVRRFIEFFCTESSVQELRDGSLYWRATEVHVSTASTERCHRPFVPIFGTDDTIFVWWPSLVCQTIRKVPMVPG